MAKLLNEAAIVGKAMAKANDFEKRGLETAHRSRPFLRR